tara:strand:+ start:170 stop:331 length:162 start_codon:yes stop_codon:yes gene_type:complete
MNSKVIIKEEETNAINEWLAKGNKITICEAGLRTDPDELVYTNGPQRKKNKKS